MMLPVCLFGIICSIVKETASEQVYTKLDETQLVGQETVLDGDYSNKQCCAHCENKQGECLAVNHKKDSGLCMVVQASGGGKPYPTSSNGWDTYIKAFTDIDYKNGATATASTTWFSKVSYAVDDQYLLSSDNCFQTMMTSTNWLRIDFNRTYPIKGLKIWNIDNFFFSLQNLIITMSPSLADIDDVNNRCAEYAGPQAQFDDNPVLLSCYKPMMGRFLKILMTDSNMNTLVVCELDLM